MKQVKSVELILYPDSTSYCCEEVLALACDFFESWAYILHDKDVDESGQPKKAHYHFLGKFSQKNVTFSGVSYQLHIPPSDVQQVNNWNSAVQYLSHFNAPEKYQYDISSISANFDVRKKCKIDDDMQGQRILAYLVDSRITSVTVLTSWCVEHGYYSGLRRGFAVWSSILRENANRSANP